MSRKAIAFLGLPQIERMLALPEGLRVLACRDDFLRDGVAVLVGGDALDDQVEGGELPRLRFELLDRSELAMQAEVHHDWSPDGGTIVVRCPAPLCQWAAEWENAATTLGLAADAVQRHLAEQHA